MTLHAFPSLVAVALLLVAGRVRAETSAYSPEAPAPNPAGVTTPPAISYSLSADARKAARLLDRRAFRAAEEFFWARMIPGSDDAGLRCQFVRFLLLSSHPATPGFVQSPLGSDHTTYFWVTHVAEDAAALAADLDPKCHPYLAQLILSSLATGLEGESEFEGRAAENGRAIPCPTHGLSHPYTGFELSLVALGWTALRLDRFEAARWAPTFERLLATPVRAGDVRSAVLLGRLAGDLRQRGRGPEDFRAANRALYTALDNSHGLDGGTELSDVVDAYGDWFSSELRAVARGELEDPLFSPLAVRIGEYGAKFPGFQPRQGVKADSSSQSVPAHPPVTPAPDCR